MKEETKQKISEAKTLKLPEDVAAEIYLMGFSIKETSNMFHCSETAIRRVLLSRGVIRALNLNAFEFLRNPKLQLGDF